MKENCADFSEIERKLNAEIVVGMQVREILLENGEKDLVWRDRIIIDKGLKRQAEEELKDIYQNTSDYLTRKRAGKLLGYDEEKILFDDIMLRLR